MNMPDYYNVFLTKMIDEGKAGLVIQGYGEVNRKRGVQWEASRLLSATSVGDKFYSVLQVGSQPVDLKSRVISSTGGGAIGRLYQISLSDITITGDPDDWYNLHFGVDTQPEAKLYAEDALTFNSPIADIIDSSVKKAADIHAITNTQNQGKGVPGIDIDSGRVFPPFSLALLELESFDASQSIAPRLEMYEGFLDYTP